MRDQRDLMAEAQARHISTLRENVRRLEEQMHRLEQRHAREQQAAAYYKMLQDAIAENPTLQSEWKRFIAIAKLSFEENVPGLTTSDERKQVILDAREGYFFR